MNAPPHEPWSRRTWLLVSAALLVTAFLLDASPPWIYPSGSLGFQWDTFTNDPTTRGGLAPASIWVPGILRAMALVAGLGAAFAALLALAGTSTRHRIVAGAGQTLRHRTSIAFAALAAAFVVTLNVNEPLYFSLVNEDAPVEDATSVGLLAASLLFAWAARRHRSDRRVWYFCAGFSVLLFLAGLDEISWGQRIFDVDTPEFFIENNDQRETNIHNTFQQWSGVRTKHVVGLAFFVYGVVVPWLLHLGKLRHVPMLGHLVFPPLFLSGAMLIGALFMVDVPTGNEEEVGEFLLSLCLCIFGTHVALSRQGMIDSTRRVSAAS